MAVTPFNILIALRDVKQFLRTIVSYITFLFWVLIFSLSTFQMVQTNFFLASNVVYYVDVNDYQKQVNGMLVNLVQWFSPLLIWLIFYFLNTIKNNVNTTTVISEIPLPRPKGKKLEKGFQCLKKQFSCFNLSFVLFNILTTTGATTAFSCTAKTQAAWNTAGCVTGFKISRLIVVV